MLKVPPCSVADSQSLFAPAAEERSGRTEFIAHGRGKHQRERSSGRRMSKAFSERRHSILAHHNNEGYLVKNKAMPS